VTLEGEGRSGGALTVVNAIPTGKGAAVGLDLATRAHARLEREPGPVAVDVEDEPDADPSLARACVDVVGNHADLALSGTVETSSDIPIARGLKSSSAAANAIVLALLDALDVEADPDQVLELSLAAARQAGVTVTGALDDAAASLLGGLVVTDNTRDEILRRKRLGPSMPVLVLVPENRRPTREAADLDDAAPAAEEAHHLLADGNWSAALTVNGLAVAAALDAPLDPAYRALGAGARAAGLSGTGPAVGAVATEDATSAIRSAWQPYQAGILTARTRDEEVGPWA
jgi:shikimate kinase